MENKTSKILLFIFIGILIVGVAFSGGIWSGFFLSKNSLAVPSSGGNSNNNSSSTTLDQLFQPFWQAWDDVHHLFYTQPIDDTKLMQGAIRGMMDSLGDPHTAYMDPLELQQINQQIEGEYEGIGAWVDASGKYLTIISPMPGYPAEKAGLLAGDEIIAVDGVNMEGVDPNVVLTHVLGPAGSTVILTIQRKEIDAAFEVNLTREKITLHSVEGELLENNIGYISINIFGDTTSTELQTTLKTLLVNKPIGLILDLRNNGGGLLDAGIEVTSQFLNQGVVVIEEQANGTRTNRDVIPGGLATDIPLVVLVNEGTASASEIVSGAIQDYNRGLLVGVKTYGKGSVQDWINLLNSQGAIRITVEHWLTPNGRQINGEGLIPDAIVPISQEDVDAGRDPQMEKAIRSILPEEIAETIQTPLVIIRHEVSGDQTLSHLALKYYGHPTEPYWKLIYEFNKVKIGSNVKNIFDGLILDIPELPAILK
jgi:carboxyl-terminal processing protease